MRGSPEQIDRAREVAAAAIRPTATASAAVRPALVFHLDASRRSDVLAWASAQSVKCTSIAGNENLQTCAAVPAAALGQPDDYGVAEEVTFEFKSSGELVHVQTMRRHLTAQAAASLAERLESAVAHDVGAPAKITGTPTTEHLGHGVLATYSAAHTFTNYRATITATNLAPTGVMVREEYLSLL